MEHHLSVPELSVHTVLPSGVRYRGRGIVVGHASLEFKEGRLISTPDIMINIIIIIIFKESCKERC